MINTFARDMPPLQPERSRHGNHPYISTVIGTIIGLGSMLGYDCLSDHDPLASIPNPLISIPEFDFEAQAPLQQTPDYVPEILLVTGLMASARIVAKGAPGAYSTKR